MTNIVHLPSAKTPSLPSNVEAEAAFLGAVMRDNSLLNRLPLTIVPVDFFEPVHARVFSKILEAVSRGENANPVTLRPHLETDEGMRALGGVGYLARLTGDPAGDLARDAFAAQIAELAERRRRIAWHAAEIAACSAIEQPLADLAPPETIGRNTKSLQLLDLATLALCEPSPKAFVVPRLFPAGEVSLFTGAGAVGKSLLAQQIATALAAGTEILGLALTKAPAVYLTCEDDESELHWRQSHICRTLQVSMSDLVGSLHIACLRGQPDNAIAMADGQGGMQPGPLFARVAALLRTTGAKLIFLDNVAHLIMANENDRGEVTRSLNLLNRLAGETGAAIVLLGHPNKGGDSYSGSTGWLNAVRSQVFMSRPAEEDDDPDLRTLTIGKPNYTQAGEALRFRWHDWAFVRDDGLFAEWRASTEYSREEGDDDLFLACLNERTRQQRAVSEKRSSTYAPTVFAKMREAKGLSSKRLEAAMDRLFRKGRIERAELWKGPDRKPVFGLRRSAGDGAGDGAGNTMRATQETGS